MAKVTRKTRIAQLRDCGFVIERFEDFGYVLRCLDPRFGGGPDGVYVPSKRRGFRSKTEAWDWLIGCFDEAGRQSSV